MKSDECLVIMPFGPKPFPDGSGKTYDFDKVYRVLIQRAIRESGMVPIRADERVTSALIHTDMFRDLRDRAVVLADLSLDNPNVFYELGIRHVMSSNGTVLMSRTGSLLLFDVKLSRVVFYDFDGANLDWEEVERVVKHLKVALQEARKGFPDSPVHALLESVVRERTRSADEHGASSRPEDWPDAEPLKRYQQLLAESWVAAKEPLSSLLEAHRGSVFGARALGYFAMATDPLSTDAKRLANQLNDGAQYRLANQLYSRLHEAGKLSRGSHLAYASSYSEEHGSSGGADRAIALVGEVLSAIERDYASRGDSADAIREYAAAYRRLAGLRQWKWQLTLDPADLDEAVAAFGQATRFTQKARDLDVMEFPGFLAQSRFKELLLLRIRDNDVERPDTERHRDAIPCATATARRRSERAVVSRLVSGGRIRRHGRWRRSAAKSPHHVRGRHEAEEQSRTLGKRTSPVHAVAAFLEQFGPHLRNPTLIGRISQILQAGNLRH